jgi:hypothetical protein
VSLPPAPAPLVTIVWGGTGMGKSRFLRQGVRLHLGARYTTFLELADELVASLVHRNRDTCRWGDPTLLAIDDPWPLLASPERPRTWEELSRRLIEDRVLQCRPTALVMEPRSPLIKPLVDAATRESSRRALPGVIRITMKPPTRRKRIRWLARAASERALRPERQAVEACAALEPWNYGVANGLLLKLAFFGGPSRLSS